MTILVTGGDGYIGWPASLRIASRTSERILLVDNFTRREWVSTVGARSVNPIADMDERLTAAEETLGLDNLSFSECDLTDRSAVNELMSVHQPTTVVHTAAQPSAPYSQMNGERANYTQHNNMQATRNLLWGLEEHGLTDTHLIETTTMGVYGAPEFPIPEGGATVQNQGEEDVVPFPAMGGSWYHIAQGYDSANLRLANTQFGIPVSELRTAITYGSETEETRTDERLNTRLDVDYYFGTVGHRFCAQAVAEYPVTVYGKGEQRKPFISLEDAVEGITRLATGDAGDRADGCTVYNQVTRAISIIELAETIASVGDEMGYDVAIEHFENPRVEDETHKMRVENDRYLDLIDGRSQDLEDGIRDVFAMFDRRQSVVSALEDRFLPSVLE
jgi:nucleoside-diphosphate-sugar epimerase